MIGLRASKWTQNLLTLAKVAGVLIVVVVGLLVAEPLGPAAQARTETPMWPELRGRRQGGRRRRVLTYAVMRCRPGPQARRLQVRPAGGFGKKPVLAEEMPRAREQLDDGVGSGRLLRVGVSTSRRARSDGAERPD